MTKVFIHILIAVVFWGTVFAQDVAKVECPTITVLGPARIVPPWELLTFNAELSGQIPNGVTYFWTINDSEIISGQRTLELNVRYTRSAWGKDVVAAIKVFGLPDICPDTASESYPVAYGSGPETKLLFETKRSPYLISGKHLTLIRDAMRQKRYAQLYVVMQFREDASEATMLRFRARLARQLAKTSIDSARMTIVTAANGKRGIKFYIVPPGAENPNI